MSDTTTIEQIPVGGSVTGTAATVSDEQLVAMLVDRARGEGLHPGRALAAPTEASRRPHPRSQHYLIRPPLDLLDQQRGQVRKQLLRPGAQCSGGSTTGPPYPCWRSQWPLRACVRAVRVMSPVVVMWAAIRSRSVSASGVAAVRPAAGPGPHRSLQSSRAWTWGRLVQ